MRIKRHWGWMTAGAVVLVGCGGADLTVQVVAEGSEGAVPQANLPVSFYPFDRDSVFDILEAEAETPRPQIPEDMIATFAEIRTLQEQWREREAEWSDVRDRMKTLSDEMAAMDPRARGTREYRAKFDEFQELEARERRLAQEKTELFDRFTVLQDGVTTRVDSFRVVRDSWEEETYEPYFDMETSLLAQLKRQMYEDTTNTAGYVTRRLPGGDWWVSTRIRVPRGEYYWNVRIDPAEMDTLQLNQGNGEERVRL